jgi:hypothetical protein
MTEKVTVLCLAYSAADLGDVVASSVTIHRLTAGVYSEIPHVQVM